MGAGCTSKQAFMGVTLPYRGGCKPKSLHTFSCHAIAILGALVFEGGFDETTAPGVIAAPGALILCQAVPGPCTNPSTRDQRLGV